MRLRASASLGSLRPIAHRLQHLRVLVVDDDADIRDAMISVLQLAGAYPLEAASAKEARRQLAFGVDLVVSDIEMPDESGLELIRSLRALQPDRCLPALAVSGWDSPAARARALAAGFDAFLAKPWSLVELCDCIASVARPMTIQ